MIDRMEPQPTDRASSRLPRSFRIRGVMRAIAVVAVWLAFFREWPYWTLAILWISGLTAFFSIRFVNERERDEGPPPGPIEKAFLIFSSLVISVILTPLVILAVAVLITMFENLVLR